MKLDLVGEDKDLAYKVLTALVTPRPIAWISTLNDDGSTINVAPFSFFNVFGTKPPLVIFTCGNRPDSATPKDTALNAKREQEFVVNLVDEAVVEAMNNSAAPLPYGTSELENSGLNLSPSSSVRTPRIEEAPVALECKLHDIQLIGDNRLIFGLVQDVHVREGILDPDSKYLNEDALSTIGRMQGPDGYLRSSDRFRMPFPRG